MSRIAVQIVRLALWPPETPSTPVHPPDPPVPGSTEARGGLLAPPVEPDPVERPDSEGGTFSPSGPSGPGAAGHYYGAVDLSVVLLGGRS